MKQTDLTSIPLVVDLDGTILRSDLLHESMLKLLRGGPHWLFALALWLRRGKAQFKRRIAERVSLDVASLPFDGNVLGWVREQRELGRRVVLCTASDAKVAHEVAAHLSVFDDVIASDGVTNMASHTKAAELVSRFGEQGFDYVGNSRADLPVWSKARRAILVGASKGVRQKARASVTVDREFIRPDGGVRNWLKAIRLHQWAKNLLLFLPLLGAHEILNPALLSNDLLAFVAFGLCASSVYILNDLMDLESDRRHPRKQHRPFAAGLLSLTAGVLASVVLLLVAFGLAWFLPPRFIAWLMTYLVVTIAYTFWLKRKVLLDVLCLAGLYTIRITAGGAAVALKDSFWLLAFSLFLFLSLAFLKRYSELQVMLAQGRDEAHGRGYRTDDLQIVQTLGIVAGFSAVLVMALYINGESVLRLYRHAEVMWLTVPILLYWISRIWVKAHRGEMHDDPLLFALRDPGSLASGAIFLSMMWLATVPW